MGMNNCVQGIYQSIIYITLKGTKLGIDQVNG